MKITAERDRYFWHVTIIEWSTKLELDFDDVDPYELLDVASKIIYQKDTKDWIDTRQKMIDYINKT